MTNKLTSAAAGRLQQRVVMTVDYEFPVPFEIFEKYINKDTLLRSILENHTQCSKVRDAILMDASLCRRLLYVYYQSFYLNPESRSLYEYNFMAAPFEWQSKLVECSASMNEPIYSQMETDAADATVNEKDSAADIVTFEVFEKYVENLHSIVQQLKLKEPDYQCRSHKDCAFMYYLAFYDTPEIRDRYPIKLKPCTSTMQKSILGKPNKDAVHALKQRNEQSSKAEDAGNTTAVTDGVVSSDFSNVVEDCGTIGFYKFPVSFDTFNRCINYDELIVPILIDSSNQDISKLSSLTRDADICMKAFKRYYHGFYLSKYIREQYDYRFAPLEPNLTKQLMSYAAPCSACGLITMGQNNNAAAKENEESSLPVTFHFFKKYITNLDEITQKMLRKKKYAGKTADECAVAYYTEFYTNPIIRKKYICNIKPCPSRIRNKLLTLTHIETTELENKRILISSGNIKYEFPVSFKTFSKYINYDEMKHKIVNVFTKGDKKQNEIILSCNNKTKKVMKRLYRTFYITPEVRDSCGYNFDGAPDDIRAKLMDIARPFNVNTETG